MQFHKIWQQIEDVLFLMVFMTVNNRIFDAFSVSLQNLLSTYNFKILSQYVCQSELDKGFSSQSFASTINILKIIQVESPKVQNSKENNTKGFICS